MSSLAMVVLNWNSADDTVRCVESLLAQNSVQPHVYVVDNASSDDSVDVLSQFIDSRGQGRVTLIKNTVNSGFSGGVNRGIHEALKSDVAFIGTLNPDATADHDWASELVSELTQHADAGIATGILARDDHEHIDSAGDFYASWGIPSPRLRDKPLSDAPKTAEYVFGATGGGFVARRELFEKIGLFDEKFFMYYEDCDLSFRAQLAGFTVRYTPEAIAFHKLSASTNKVPGLAVTQTFKNLPMLFVKNVPLGLWLEVWPRFTLAYGLIFANALRKGRGLYAIKGWLMSLLLAPYSFRERWKIQRKKVVSTEYIRSIIIHDIPEEQTGLRAFRRVFTGK